MHEQILKLCRQKGITLAEMCRELGIAQTTLSNAKRRKRPLNSSRLYTIARYFGVSMEYLMGKEDDIA